MNTMREIKTEFSSNFISDTNGTVIKKEEVEEAATSFTMPIENRHPLVLTTRLDEMCVLQKTTLSLNPKKNIKNIYLESKAACRAENTPGFKYVCRCSKKKKKNHKLKFRILRYKLDVLKSKTKFESTNANVTQTKKRSVIAVDVSSDDYWLNYKVKRNKVENSNSILYKYLEQNKTVDLIKDNPINKIEHYDYQTLVNNLRKIVDITIIKKTFKFYSNIVIVVNNLYSQTMDIYVKDLINNFFEYVTIPLGHYSLFYKLLVTHSIKQKVKPKYSLLWINCCCWVQRQKEIKKKCLWNTAQFLFSSHTCHLKCSCCCNEEKTEPAISCNTEVYSSKKNSNTAIEEEKICNPLIKMALSFKKPINKRNKKLNTEVNKQYYRNKNPSCMQFIFKTVGKKDRHVEVKVSDSKGYIKTDETISNSQFEFVQLSLRRELVCHSFIIPQKLVRTLESVRRFKDLPLDVCCEVRFKCLVSLMCVQYDIGPAVFKYIEEIHKSNIYRKYFYNRPEKCPQCKEIKTLDDKRGTVGIEFKVVSAPIEHTRKVIKGRIVRPKIEMLAHSKHMNEKAKTIQEMMEKVKTKFPNMSYFINSEGLPTASLPMPFHCYPTEDIKYLTQVLKCIYSEIQINSKQPIKSNPKSIKPPTIYDNTPIDFCTSLIARNKKLYIESFKSFVNTSIDPNRMELQEEQNLPKIVDVCSLSDNKEIAKKLHDANADDITF